MERISILEWVSGTALKLSNMVTTLIILLAIILVLLIFAHKVDRSLLKTGKYVYKNSWLQLIITVENEKDRSNTSEIPANS